MWPFLLDYLCCPNDSYSPLTVEAVDQSNDGEIINGQLHCNGCGKLYPIIDGVASMMPWNYDDLNETQSIQLREMQARDRGSANYEASFSSKRNQVELNAILGTAGLKGSDKVLEVGCGTGRIGRVLATHCQCYVGVDLSLESLRYFQQKASQQKVNLIQGDITRLPIKSKVFSHSYAFQVLEHLPSQSSRLEAVESLARVLEGGGSLMLTVYNYSIVKRLRNQPKDGFHSGTIYFHNFKAEELWRLVEQAALTPTTCLGLQTPAYKLSASFDHILQSNMFGRLLGHLLLIKARKEHSALKAASASALAGNCIAQENLESTVKTQHICFSAISLDDPSKA